MTPEQMRLRAVDALAEEFDRTHEDPHADAARWIGRLLRSGWRPLPALADGVPPRPTPASRENRERARAQIQAALTRNREDQP